MPNPFAPRSYGELQKLSENVYIVRNITNSSFIIGDRAVAVIDTQVNRCAAEQVLSFIRSVTDKPIAWAINTHYHWDHTNGNQLFKDQGAAVVASEKTKTFMTIRQDRQKEFLSGRGFELGRDPLLPEITFEKEHFIDLGGQSLRLFHAGNAETEDATAIYVSKEKVLISGDTIMTGSFPIFGQPCWDEGLEGDGQWQRTIQALLALKADSIIPGHGPLASPKDAEFLIRIENYFIEEVRALAEKGLSLEQVLAALEPRLPEWITRLPVVWGTPRYAILRVFRGLTKKASDPQPGWQQFKPSAIPGSDASKTTLLTAGERGVEEYLQLAKEALEGGDQGLCLDILKKATTTYPDRPAAWNAYAEALVDASRREASVLEKGDFFLLARRCWDTSLQLDPGNPGALLGKGRYLTMMAYRGGDDPRPGMNLLEKALSLAGDGPTRAQAQFYLGIGYRRLGEEPKAQENFRRSLKMDPAFIPAQLAMQKG